MKKTLLKTIALTSALAMALPLFSACGNKEEKVEAASYVAIDINPSISISLDEDNKVVAVYSANEDAQVMLYQETLEGLKLEVALEKIAELSVDLGYVNEENYGVSVSVNGKIGENEVIGQLESAFDKESGSLSINVSGAGSFSDLRKLEAVKANYSANVEVQNLTLSEYKLIADVQAIDETITVEEAVEMSTDELMQIVAEGAIAIEPYATKAYNVALGVAERAYNELKGQLLDAMWVVPYAKDYANILTGGRKYAVNNGAIYNMYTASSRALGVSIDAIEKAIEIANATQVPDATLEKIATALNLTEEQKAQFLAEVKKEGVATLASLENYLDKWFKNLTSEERAKLEATVNTLMADVQAFATKIDQSIAQEYKDALGKLASDLTDLIPTELKTLASAYVTEFENLVAKISSAVEGKEPLVSVKAVKEVFDNEATRIMGVMREELTKEDLASVESNIEKVNSTLESYEQKFLEAKAKAEADAKAWLENAKANRKTA